MQGVEGWGATTRPCYDSICYSLWYQMVLFLDAISSPHPSPCLVLCRLLSSSALPRPSPAACHPLPDFVTKFAALVDCRCNCRPLLLHRSPCQRYDIAPAVVAVTPRRRSCEMLMSTSTLASTAFASHLRPLAEQRCRLCSHVAPNACRCHCCCCRGHLRIVGIFAATPTFVEPTPPGEPSCRNLQVRRRARLCPISFLLIVA